MEQPTGKRIVHSYDVIARRVLCGVAEQSSSTKHAAGVTCPACRALLPRGAHAMIGFGGDAADHHAPA